MLATHVFARYARAASQCPVPPEVLHHAQRAVIDWYASLYPGLAMPAVQLLEATMADDLDRGDARLGLGRAATPRAAALINGTAAHAAEVDDSFRDAMVHPGAATIAAALAAAQARRSSGADFLRAVVMGYEVSTRMGTNADIENVHLGVYQATLDIAPHVDPQTADQARFSLHYVVASALVHGSVRLSAFEPERLRDPATRLLMHRIRKALDPEVDAGFPGRRAARVTVTLRDGRVLSHLQPDRKGDPELPLSDADLEGKLLELAAPVIGDAAASALLQRIWALSTCETLPT